MSYKFTTGSLRKGDIYYEDDREGEPTYIDFSMDAITLRPSGSQILHATANAVGVGITLPDATFHVHADNIQGGVVRISQADNSGDASQLDLSKARGSGASPAAVQSNDFLGQVRFLAYDGNSHDNFADIYAQAAGTVSTTSHPTKIVMRTSKVGSSSPSTAITIDENQNLIAEGNLEAKDQITIRNQNPPASATANGMRGEIRYDDNYIYIAIADNIWKRVAISDW